MMNTEHRSRIADRTHNRTGVYRPMMLIQTPAALLVAALPAMVHGQAPSPRDTAEVDSLAAFKTWMFAQPVLLEAPAPLSEFKLVWMEHHDGCSVSMQDLTLLVLRAAVNPSCLELPSERGLYHVIRFHRTSHGTVVVVQCDTRTDIEVHRQVVLDVEAMVHPPAAVLRETGEGLGGEQQVHVAHVEEVQLDPQEAFGAAAYGILGAVILAGV